MDVDPTNSKSQQDKDFDDYPFEVLTTEEIVQHMTDCIKEVNTVVEVSLSLWWDLVESQGLLEFSDPDYWIIHTVLNTKHSILGFPHFSPIYIDYVLYVLVGAIMYENFFVDGNLPYFLCFSFKIYEKFIFCELEIHNFFFLLLIITIWRTFRENFCIFLHVQREIGKVGQFFCYICLFTGRCWPIFMGENSRFSLWWWERKKFFEF